MQSCTIIVPAIPYANVEKKLLTTYTCLCKNLYTPSFLLPLSPLIRSSLAAHLSPLTPRRSPLTSHLSPLPSHLSPLTSHR